MSGVTCLQKTVEETRELLAPHLRDVLTTYVKARARMPDADAAPLRHHLQHRLTTLAKHLHTLPLRLIQQPLAHCYQDIQQDSVRIFFLYIFSGRNLKLVDATGFK